MSKKNITISIFLAILMIAIGIGIGIRITKINSEQAVVGGLNRDLLVSRSNVELKEVSFDKRDGVVELDLNKKDLNKKDLNKKRDVSTKKLDVLKLKDKDLATANLKNLDALPDLQLKDLQLLSHTDKELDLVDGLDLGKDLGKALLDKRDGLVQLALNDKLGVSAKELDVLTLNDKAPATADLKNLDSLSDGQLRDLQLLSLPLKDGLLEGLAA